MELEEEGHERSGGKTRNGPGGAARKGADKVKVAVIGAGSGFKRVPLRVHHFPVPAGCVAG